MIDPHVHFRDGLLSEKETIAHGALTGALSGFTAFFDMPNTKPPLTNAQVIYERFNLAEKQLSKVPYKVFYAVYGGLTVDSVQITNLVNFYKNNFPKIIGFKMFAGHSTGNMGIIKKDEQKQVYFELSRLNYKGVLAIHCEKEEFINNELFNLEKPETHSICRPPCAEIESIKDQIELMQSEKFKGHVHICHISTKEGIALVKKAKEDGLNISCGATAHHALLNINTYKTCGVYAKMNPPLRKECDREAVFNELLFGSVDCIESDHAPHTLSDKKNGASGIPGFAGSLILIRELRKAGCSHERLNELCGGAVNRIFNVKIPYNVPKDSEIEHILPFVKSSYPFDIFKDY